MGNDITDLASILIIGGLAYYLIVGGGLQNISSIIPNLGSAAGTGGGGGGNVAPGSPIRFSAAGDWGSGRNDNWKEVVAEMKKFKPNVVINTGDASYTNAGDFEPVATAIKAIPAKFIGINGNHDGSDYAPLHDDYSNSVVNVGNTSFLLLDTESGSKSVSFAKANISKMTQKWKVVLVHHPILTVKSKHSNDEGKVGEIVPLMEEAGVHLVLSGDNHLYARLAPKNGITHITVGTGGESHYSGSGTAEKINDSDFGTLNVTTSANSMTGKFVTVDGTVDDTFTITDSKAALVKAYNTYKVRPMKIPYIRPPRRVI